MNFHAWQGLSKHLTRERVNSITFSGIPVLEIMANYPWVLESEKNFQTGITMVQS